MAELADAIVETGKTTLEWAKKIIEEKWSSSSVVYGDTDSLFIRLKGCSKGEAFRIGKLMADYVTSLSPKSIVLKFEKVYLGCVLVTKKRYAGLMFDSVDQKIGHFDYFFGTFSRITREMMHHFITVHI